MADDDTAFFITFSGGTMVRLDEVWPDGDAPESPTSADVIEVMKKSGSKPDLLYDWSLADDLEITVDQGVGPDSASW